MKFFWINLDTSPGRKANMLREFKENGIRDEDHYRIEAYHSFKDTRPDRENACIRSHIQAIFHFLMDTRDEVAIICEDDLTFEYKPYWKRSLEDVIKQAPSDWGAIQLAVILQKIDKRFSHRELYFNYNDDSTSSTLAYAINRKCAMELLPHYIAQSTKLNFPTADCFRNGIFARINKLTKLSSYTYKYPMFTYPNENDSQIQDSMALHIASKKHVTQYLKKYNDQDRHECVVENKNEK